MFQDSLYNLYSKSNAYWLAFLLGKKSGRKLKVWNFQAVYFSFFYQLATNMFKYEGLDYRLQKEIERRLFYFGRVGIINHEGKLAAVDVNTFDFDIYGRPEKFTFCFKNGDKDNKKYTRIIDVNGAFGTNTYEMMPTALVAEMFAFVIAHADTSITNDLINMRMTDIIKASTENEAEQARAYLRKVYDGEQGVIVDKTEDMEIIRPTSAHVSMLDALETRDRYIRDFFNIIGVNRFEEKKERVVVDEVNANEPMLKLDVKDMYESRVEMCKSIEKVFDVKCSVIPVVDIDGDNILEGGNENV